MDLLRTLYSRCNKEYRVFESQVIQKKDSIWINVPNREMQVRYTGSSGFQAAYYKIQNLAIAEKDGGMTIAGLRRLATSVGIENANTIAKTDELIHAIQNLVNDDACFNLKSDSFCSVKEVCMWKTECKKLIAKYGLKLQLNIDSGPESAPASF